MLYCCSRALPHGTSMPRGARARGRIRRVAARLPALGSGNCRMPLLFPTAYPPRGGSGLAFSGGKGMPRAPYNVLVIPWYRAGSCPEYCVFKRKDMGVWQFIAGGGEAGETPVQAAVRESLEEAGIAADGMLKRLTAGYHVPACCFSDEARAGWGPSVIVVPAHCFAVEVKSRVIAISREHTAFQWAGYDAAYSMLRFDADKTAMYETDQRIRRNDWQLR